jgi:hypothetical protein
MRSPGNSQVRAASVIEGAPSIDLNDATSNVGRVPEQLFCQGGRSGVAASVTGGSVAAEAVGVEVVGVSAD